MGITWKFSMGWPKLSQNSILEQNSVGLGFIGGEGEGNTHFPVFLRIHKEPETAGRCRNQLQEKKIMNLVGTGRLLTFPSLWLLSCSIDDDPALEAGGI